MCHREDTPILSLQIKGFEHSMNYSMAGDRDEMNGNMAKKLSSAFSVPPGVLREKGTLLTPLASKQHIPLRGFQTQGLGQTLPLIDVFIHRERRNKLLSRVDRLGVCPCMGGRPGDLLVY
ncbi:hypothetical protein SUGI_1455680 [Cryptomeria japonica]|uniref:Uncharacterized protein n=1 Tax=Cryptomeria japonica TaxID=3369 RepID=A0AAD3NQZ7_CRYJA|nr:hypothetical protein SUGI_1424570 [Cryptomeria japonica]GLJ58529.1 hypothetical protein SUGI_1455680 [Cryptomeria japonica]